MRMIIQPGARSARRVLTIVALGAILGAFLVWSAGSALASSQHAQTVQTKVTKGKTTKGKTKTSSKGGASAAALAAGKAEHCPAGKTIEQSSTNDQDADNFGGADDFDGCL